MKIAIPESVASRAGELLSEGQVPMRIPNQPFLPKQIKSNRFAKDDEYGQQGEKLAAGGPMSAGMGVRRFSHPRMLWQATPSGNNLALAWFMKLRIEDKSEVKRPKLFTIRATDRIASCSSLVLELH